MKNIVYINLIKLIRLIPEKIIGRKHMKIKVTIFSCLLFNSLCFAGVPLGMVTFTTHEIENGTGMCPQDGWTEASFALGRVLMGTNDPQEVRVSRGNTMKNQSLPSHTHKTGPGISIATELNNNKLTNNSTEISTTVITTGTQMDLPVVQYLVCEKTKSTDIDTFPYGSVAFFNSLKCPDMWVPENTLIDRFTTGITENGEMGYTTGYGWPEIFAHQHELPANFNMSNVKNKSDQINEKLKEGDVANSFPPWTLINNEWIPFVKLMACRKNNSSTKTNTNKQNDIPSGITMFYGSKSCPTDWEVTPATSGRLIVGVSEIEEQGLAFGDSPLIESAPYFMTHSHTLSNPENLSQKPFNLPVNDKGVINNQLVLSSGTDQIESSTVRIPLQFTVFQTCSKK